MTARFDVLLGGVQGLGAEGLGDRQALGDGVDREHVGGSGGAGDLHRAQPHRTESEHRHQVAGAHAAFLDRVEAGAHHVAGEQRHLGAHALGHLAQDEVGVGDQGHLGLGSLQRAERGSVAEGARVHTAVEQAPAAEEAVAVGGLEAAQHPVPDRHAARPVAGGHDRADVLVPDREAGLDLDAPVVDVQVRPAHPAELDPHDRVGGRLGLGLGRSSSVTTPGAWNVTARMARAAA